MLLRFYNVSTAVTHRFYVDRTAVPLPLNTVFKWITRRCSIRCTLRILSNSRERILFRFRFDCASISLQSQFGFNSAQFQIHIDLASSPLRFHFGVASISLQIHFKVTSISLRFRFEFTCMPLLFHFHLIVVSHRFHIDFM